MNKSEQYIAHVRKHDKEDTQSLKEHLSGVAALSSEFASKLGLGLPGELIGLLHDLGKYSQQFQNYLKSATNILNPDEDDEFVDSKGLKGKIDHSTSGAQLIWQELSKIDELGQVVGQILALCVASHHSGLIDCLSSDSTNPVSDNFSRRMEKPDAKTHLTEALENVDHEIRERFQAILKNKELTQGIRHIIDRIVKRSPNFILQDPLGLKDIVAQFQIGLMVRLLFSQLVDADRIDSANFEDPSAAYHRRGRHYTEWGKLSTRLEVHLSSLSGQSQINEIRKDISNHCLNAAQRVKGVYTLTVPTGGGKTLASLRFALNHAKNHSLDRIVYVIPFTSIIDQNADVARQILEPDEFPEDKGRIVLEHHSNLGHEVQSWREKLMTENWDAPVIFTTSVQFLEALFGSGTRGARRMHRLANSVIIFDEIQTLPIKCVHIFNNSINFLVEQCGSTVVLCTATQPLLHKVEVKKGSIRLTDKSEIMPDVRTLFDSLKRVEISDKRKPGGWNIEDTASLAINEMKESGSCLVVVNTKKAARELYSNIEGQVSNSIFHLSTSMCPVHRRSVLKNIRHHLDAGNRVLCLSTQLIEAGVDVDFGSVIRYAAGMDSIAQAAGRCNRNGKREIGTVHIVNPADENLKNLEDIRIGLEKAERVLDDFKRDAGRFGGHLLSKEVMDWYYENYFYSRKNEMDYRIEGRGDTILNLLSLNSILVGDYKRAQRKSPTHYLRHSFMAAARAFRAIDAPTQGVIVQYDKAGKDLVAELCGAFELEKQTKLLRQAQQYTVNVFPHEFKKLLGEEAALEVQADSGVYYLSERYYSNEFGLSTIPVSGEEFLNV